MGFDWEDRLFYGSDYFEDIYNHAVNLIKKGLAYVDDLSPEEIKSTEELLQNQERKAHTEIVP